MPNDYSHGNHQRDEWVIMQTCSRWLALGTPQHPQAASPGQALTPPLPIALDFGGKGGDRLNQPPLCTADLSYTPATRPRAPPACSQQQHGDSSPQLKSRHAAAGARDGEGGVAAADCDGRGCKGLPMLSIRVNAMTRGGCEGSAELPPLRPQVDSEAREASEWHMMEQRRGVIAHGRLMGERSRGVEQRACLGPAEDELPRSIGITTVGSWRLAAFLQQPPGRHQGQNAGSTRMTATASGPVGGELAQREMGGETHTTAAIPQALGGIARPPSAGTLVALVGTSHPWQSSGQTGGASVAGSGRQNIEKTQPRKAPTPWRAPRPTFLSEQRIILPLLLLNSASKCPCMLSSIACRDWIISPARMTAITAAMSSLDYQSPKYICAVESIMGHVLTRHATAQL